MSSLVWFGLLGSAARAFTGSDAFVEYRRSGREVIQEYNHDFNQDGRADVLVIGQGPHGLEVSAYRNEGQNRFTLMSRSTPIEAENLVSFGSISLAKENGFLLHALEDSPDEADHFVQLFRVNPAGLVSIWSYRYRLVYQQQQTSRTSLEEVDLGGYKLGLRFRDPSEAGWPIIEINANSKRLTLNSVRGEAQVLVGHQRSTFIAKRGHYQLDDKQFIEYLRPHRIKSLDPQFQNVIDGQLNTTWRAPLDKMSLKVAIENPTLPIRMLRIIPGCADSDHSWNEAGQITRFRLVFDGTQEMIINRHTPEQFDPRVLGQADFVIPNKQAIQTLVFFRKPIRAQTLELVALESNDPHKTACLSELSMHWALRDKPKKQTPPKVD